MACCDAAWTSSTVGCEGSLPCSSSDLFYHADHGAPCNPRGVGLDASMAPCVPEPGSINENLGLAYALSAKLNWADCMDDNKEDKSTVFSMSPRDDVDAQSGDFDSDLCEAAAACEEPTHQAAVADEPDHCWEPTLQAEDSEEQLAASACQEPTLQAHTSRGRWVDLEDSDKESANTETTVPSAPARRERVDWADMSDSEADELEEGTWHVAEEKAEEPEEVYVPAPRSRRSERKGRRADEAKNVAEEKGWKSWEQSATKAKNAAEPKWKKSWEDASWNATVQHKAGGKGGKGSGKGEKGNYKGHGKAAGKGWNNAEGGKKSGKGSAKGAGKGAGKAGAEKFQCQFVIGIEEDSKFRVVRRLIGSGGEHMKAIYEQTGAKLRLRGRGSKFEEGPEKKESTDDLMRCISTNDWHSYANAQRLVTELLEGIYQSYRVHCKKAGQTNPELRIQMHEGYREGSR